MTSRSTRNLLLLCIGIPLSVAHATTADQAKLLAWSDQSRAALSASFSNIDSVNEFVRNLLPPVPAGDPPLSVVDYTFADLSGDGSLQLICSLSDGVRFSPTILVISKYGDNFAWTEVYNGGSMDLPDIKDVLIHAGGSAQTELLVPRRLGAYQGVQPVPIVYDIYKLRNGVALQADLEFTSYYRNVLLPRIKAEIGTKSHAPSSGNADLDNRGRAEVVALKTELKAMQKMLGIKVVASPAAGAVP